MQRRPDLKSAALHATSNLSAEQVILALPQPVIILSPPRSGSTLVFEYVSKLAPFWSIGGESHAIFHAFPQLRANNQSLESMALDRSHADTALCDVFRRCCLVLLQNHRSDHFLSIPPNLRPRLAFFLEKTPRNALNISFLREVFPNAHYIYLLRQPEQTISSLIEAWELGLKSNAFVTFNDLPNWPLKKWCFVLPHDWQDMAGKPIAEIATFQWRACHEAIIDGLCDIARQNWTPIHYQDFVDHPGRALGPVFKALGLKSGSADFPTEPLPLSRTTVTPPAPDKWRRHEADIAPLVPMISKMQARIDAFCKASEAGT